MSTANDLASLLRTYLDEGCYFPDPEVTVDRTSRLRSIRMPIYWVNPNGYMCPLPSKASVSSIYKSFKTNLKSIRRVPVATEITEIWQYTCLSYAYGSDQIPLPPIMADYPGTRKEEWFKLTVATLPGCTHDEAATEEGGAQAAQ